MRRIVKIVFMLLGLSLGACTDGDMPPRIYASYKISNKSDLNVKIKYRTFYEDMNNHIREIFDSTLIYKGDSILLELSENDAIPYPFGHADSLIISNESVFKTYQFKDSSPNNLLRYECYKQTLIEKHNYKFEYIITDNDFK